MLVLYTYITYIIPVLCLPQVACFLEFAAPTLEVAVDVGGVGRVLKVVAHLVVVRQKDKVSPPLAHHASETVVDFLIQINYVHFRML